MQKKQNYSKVDAVLAGIGLGLGISLLTSSFFAQKEIEEMTTFLNDYPHTSAGRFALSEQDGQTMYPVNQLNIVRYQNQYYVTDQNLKMIGGDITYSLVEDESLRGKKYQICSNDIIPFQTITNYEIVTWGETYDFIDQSLSQGTLIFPDKSVESTYSLNENCCQVAWNYARGMRQEGVEFSYKLNDIYAIYFKGNVYLCIREDSDSFAVIYDGVDYPSHTIRFSLSGAFLQNYIIPEQIVKLSNLCSKVHLFSEDSKLYSINELYQLLSTSLEIIDNPFQPYGYSSRKGFTKDQVANLSKKFQNAYQYLDAYQVDWYQCAITYKPDDILIVRFSNQYWLINRTILKEDHCYFMYPIHISDENLSKEIFPLVYEFEIMEFRCLIPKLDFGMHTSFRADQYYQMLIDYMIQFGDPFEDETLSSYRKNLEDVVEEKEVYEEPVYIDPTIQELGKRLDLKLVYEKNV